MADQPVILNDEQLRRLAKLIYYQEVEAIQNIKFRSEPEQAEYLRKSKDNYNSVLDLLNAGGELKRKCEDDTTRAPIASDIFSYIVNGTNYALQIVQNYTLRESYLSKLNKHTHTLIGALEMLDTHIAEAVTELAEEAAQYGKAVLEYTQKYRSSASRNFSKWLKDTGMKFDDLVKSHQTKLGYHGPFEKLEDEKKIKVYGDIIETSGRGKVETSTLSNAFENVGKAVELFSAAMTVWDIFSADHVIKAATREAVVQVASEGGAYLGEVVGAAIAVDLSGAEASVLFVTLAGTLGGFLGAFILGAFAGSLIDLIFASGGSAHFSTEGHVCYVATMPDGIALARRIAHQH